jgi:hypothetical protein
VQEFVKEANAEDIRCLVIGDKVVASMMHRGKEGDFRSNLHRGGSAFPIKISPQELATAIGSAKALGPSVCGHAALQPRAGGDGSQFIAWPGRHRKSDQRTRGGVDDRVHREKPRTRRKG